MASYSCESNCKSSSDRKVEDKTLFEVGESVLVSSDDLVYVGRVVKIDASRDSYLIQFEDHTKSWTKGCNISKDTYQTDYQKFCIICKSSKNDDSIITCCKCDRTFHPECHVPEVPLIIDSKWRCTMYCQQTEKVNTERRILPMRKSSMSSAQPTSNSSDLSIRKRTMSTLPPVNVIQRKKFPYKLSDLTWDQNHQVNKEGKYCYCGDNGNWYVNMLQCGKCKQWFHVKCISATSYPVILGDRFYIFVCALCNSSKEFLRRLHLNWIDVTHLALYNLILLFGKRHFHLESDIMKFLNKHWRILQLTSDMKNIKTDERKRKIYDALITKSDRFVSNQENNEKLWSLKTVVPPFIPIFTLPPNKPLNDSILSKVWNNRPRLKFLPQPQTVISQKDKLELLQDIGTFIGFDKKEGDLPGRKFIEKTKLVLPKGLQSRNNGCVKLSSDSESQKKDSERLKRMPVKRLKRKAIDQGIQIKIKRSLREFPPTPPSSDDVQVASSTTVSSGEDDNQSIQGALDSLIPRLENYKGKNNPFSVTSPVKNNFVNVNDKYDFYSKQADMNKFSTLLRKPVNRRLSEKDIIITSKGEVKRKYVRRKFRRNAKQPPPTISPKKSTVVVLNTPIASPVSSPIKDDPPKLKQNFWHTIDLTNTSNILNNNNSASNDTEDNKPFGILARRASIVDGLVSYLVEWNPKVYFTTGLVKSQSTSSNNDKDDCNNSANVQSDNSS